jgi:hypothetical protein
MYVNIAIRPTNLYNEHVLIIIIFFKDSQVHSLYPDSVHARKVKKNFFSFGGTGV